jgi:CYTH domain-containing protein
MPDDIASEARLPVETERKWLLDALPAAVHAVTPDLLRQGYLPGEAIVERIRLVDRAGVTEWVRTIKLGRGISRVEVEETVSDQFGEALWSLTEGRRVIKRRYRIPDGALTWEIDEFTDRPLVLAELEVPDAAYPVVFPGWIVQNVVREVTDDVEFTNWRLAR